VQIQEATRMPLPSSSPVAATFTQPAEGSDVFIPYQPEGPRPNTMLQQEAIRWLPPNTSTPTPMKRGDLPVFTATSAIPFGLPPNPDTNVPTAPKANETSKPAEDSKKYDDSIWEVPETPQKK
jgi:histone deacetylase HOS3